MAVQQSGFKYFLNSAECVSSGTKFRTIFPVSFSHEEWTQHNNIHKHKETQVVRDLKNPNNYAPTTVERVIYEYVDCEKVLYFLC